MKKNLQDLQPGDKVRVIAEAKNHKEAFHNQFKIGDIYIIGRITINKRYVKTTCGKILCINRSNNNTGYDIECEHYDEIYKEFTAEQMIEFANWFGEDISEKDLNSYRDMLKQREEQEYQLYLTLKAKYE
jgi:CRISPR-associated protein Cas8b1/Cst1 subtype I-B